MSAAGKSANAFRDFDKALGKAQSSLLSFRNLAIAGVVVGLGVLVTKSLGAIDAMDDAAKAAGLTTTRYQELRFAAQFAGVSQENFASAMVRFAKVSGEAAAGSKSAIEDFDALKVSIRDGNNNLKTQDQLMNAVIKGISAFSNQSERAAAAAGFFGKDAGPKLAAFMGQGEAAIAALVAQAHELGLVLDESLINGAVEANDKIEVLATVLQTKLSVAMVNLAPFIVTATDALIDFVEWVGRAAGAIPGSIEGINAELDALASKQDGDNPDWLQRQLGMPGEDRRLSPAEKRRRAELQAALSQKLPGPSGYPGGGAPTITTLPIDPAAVKKAEAEAEKWAEKLRDLREAGLDHTKSVMDAEEAEELKHLTRRMEALTGFEKQKMDAQAAYRDATDEMRADALEKELDAADKSADAWGNALRETVRNFDILFDKSLSGWERVGKFALETLTRIAEAAATQMGGGEDPYKQAGGWLATAANAAAAYFGASSSAGGASSVNGTTAGSGGPASGQFMADGGPVSAGRSYVVGERGPEMFVPKSAGDIIPNNKMGGGSGGSSANQTIVFNVSPGVPEAVRREVAAMIPTITRATKVGVSDDARRNRQAS